MKRFAILCLAMGALIGWAAGCDSNTNNNSNSDPDAGTNTNLDAGHEQDAGGDPDAAVFVCGNGVVGGNELCDSAALDGKTCVSQGFTAGPLLCNAACDGFDTSFCIHGPNRCGNDVREEGEACDGQDVGFFTCSSFGGSGQLACRADCTFDPSGCVVDDYCAQNGYYWNGVCDPCENLGGVPDPDCEHFCGADGRCADYSGPQTGYLPSCLLATGVRDPDCNPGVCGDGTTGGWEACDTLDFAGQSCVSLGFAAGTLACDSGCRHDVTACVRHPCGDDSADGNEICDGADLAGQDCTSILAHRFVGGTLSCNATCDGWDTSACVAPVCGDGLIEGLEQCDGANVAGVQCVQVGYLGGTVACDATCHFDWSGCTVPTCGDGVVEGYEQCDGVELGGHDCTDWGFSGGLLACDPSCVVFDFSGCLGSPTSP